MTPKPAPNLTFNVTMKQVMIEHLDEMVIASGCSTRSEYLRGLIRDDQKARKAAEAAKKRMAAMAARARKEAIKNMKKTKP